MSSQQSTQNSSSRIHRTETEKLYSVSIVVDAEFFVGNEFMLIQGEEFPVLTAMSRPGGAGWWP